MLIHHIYSHCPCNKANRQEMKAFSLLGRFSMVITISMINFMICFFIDERGGRKPDSIMNVISKPCNAPGVLPIDEYFRLQENCLDSYRATTSIQHFADDYQNMYALHFNLNNSETIKDGLNYAIESIQIQYNHLKAELKKQGALRIPCIQEYLTQIKDNAYYKTPYYRGMKALYISILLGIICLLLTLTFVNELFIDLKEKTGEEKVGDIIVICIICGFMSLIHSLLFFEIIKKLLASPTHSMENFINIDFEKLLLNC